MNIVWPILLPWPFFEVILFDTTQSCVHPLETKKINKGKGKHVEDFKHNEAFENPTSLEETWT